MWQIPKMWDGERCWIIGGGVSFPKQFGVPDDVVDKVTSGELSPYSYIPWLKPLQKEHVIGTNIAYLLGKSVVDILLFSDPPFFRANHSSISAFSGLKVTCARLGSIHSEYQRGIRVLRKDLRSGIDVSKRDSIRWNGHTGGGAINLAVLLGVKEIYLLGFDMKPDEKGRTHWHKQYTSKTKQNVFDSFQKSFRQISRDAEKLGVKIINVNPDSAVVEFTKMELQEVLNQKKPTTIQEERPLVDMRTDKSYKRSLKDKGKGVMHKYKILSLFHEIYNPQLYFEIGVDRGVSIRLAKCKAIGVDPEPNISGNVEAEIHVLKSDTFFEKNLLNKRIPDLVFIDGLHHFDQVLRDFRNTEKNCRSGTIIVIDDILPSHPSETMREWQSRAWTGDVWKVVPILEKYRPDLKMVLLDSNPTGLLAITNLDPENTVLWNNYNTAVDEWMSAEVPGSVIDREGLDVKKNIEEQVRNFGLVEEKKILCFVNHYYNPTQKEGFKGKATVENSKREEIVKKVISRLKEIPGCCVKVCGLKGFTVPGVEVDIDFTGIQPWNLVYESLHAMAPFADDYDYFINIEDDIFIGNDVIQNVIEFDQQRLIDEILLPNRIEIEVDGTYQFVDLKTRWKKDSIPSSFKGIPLNIANNCHSGILILSTEKYKNAYSMLDPNFREVWWGGPMASAYAYFHSGFQLYRNSDLTKFHSIIHLDHWQPYKENNGVYSKSGEERIRKAKEVISRVKYSYKPIKVEVCYGLDMKLAEAYNEALESAKTDWVLLLDHDVIVGLNPHWYEICVHAIHEVDDKVGLITCVSNYRPRRRSKGSQFPDIRIDSTDVNKHINVAKELYDKHGTTLRKINTYKVAGFFMLVRRSVWEEVQFRNVGRGVDQIDWDYGMRLQEKGYSMYELPGLYVYHHRDIRKMDWGAPNLKQKETVAVLPETFCDWIHYYMKHPYPDYDYGLVIDKHKVKKFVDSIVNVAKEYAYLTTSKQIDEFDFGMLPKDFVIKATHGSHMNIIVRDGVAQPSANQRYPKPFEVEEARAMMKQWLNTRFAESGELYYDEVERGVLIEEHLSNYFTDYEKENGIVDYKAWCFHGRIEFIGCANSTGNKVNYYDAAWNELPFRRDDRCQVIDFPKPKNLTEIIEVYYKLLDKIGSPPFVRVDLYNFGDKIFFGEYTHSPGKGDKIFLSKDKSNPINYELKFGKSISNALTVVCFKWKHTVGEPLPAVAKGVKYDAGYINKLYHSIERNLTIPHQFVCVTDDPEGLECETYPLWDWGREFGRCFTRLKMFDPAMKRVFGKRVVCIDADTVVIGNLDKVFSRKEDFIIHTYYPDSHQYQQKYNGSLFMMDIGCRPEVYTKFEGQQSVDLLKELQAEKKVIGSDQAWINYILGDNEKRFGEEDGVYHLRNIMIPKRRTHRRKGDLPKDARLVMFSGSQDPSFGLYQKFDWVKKNWL